MGPRPLARFALAALGLAAAAGCGDPVVVLGDLPGILRIVAGIPNSPGIALDSLATRSQLDAPQGVAASSDGVLYVASPRRQRIVAIQPNGRLELLADHQECQGALCMVRPEALALDSRGGLLVADPRANRVFRIDLATRAVGVVAGTGVEASAPDGTAARQASLSRPAGVLVDGEGRIYVSELTGDRVRTIEPDGTLRTVAGSGSRGSSGDGGPAQFARLALPAGLALGGGLLYIVDSANQRVRAVELASGVIKSVAGTGIRGFAGDGGPATEALLQDPQGVAVSPDGRTLFIADAGNHRVRTVNLATGLIATFAGTGDEAFTGDRGP
ncbi:MAG: hypothetical protein HY703_12105, partial [Gemmatimonadetes bacterium]|nr:hypothetical protein [Gemmatimonadota bacterium]